MVRFMLRALSSINSRLAGSYTLTNAPSPRKGFTRFWISPAVAYFRKIRFITMRSSSGSVLGSLLTIGESGSWLMRFTGTMRYVSPTFTMAAPFTRRMVSNSGMYSTGLTSP